ncbi:MAG: lipid-A-disaccharide synthase [Pseudomonadota bacterium]
MIIAGEASGDQHGAKVVRALRELAPDLFFFGIGGQALRAAGVQIFFDAAQLAVVGITEIFAKLPHLIKGMSAAKRLLKTVKPDLLLLIDFPDFNLNIAAAAKKHNIPVLYYISPQIWAWRSGRVKKIRDRVNHMAVILPFEAVFYERHGVPVSFVGHPLLDDFPFASTAPGAPLSAGEGIVGLLPGSRDREVARLLPDMLAAIPLLRRQIPNIRFIVSLSPSVKRSFLESILAAHCPKPDIEIEAKGVHTVLAKSTLVVAASGTVTLEAAMAGCPMVIIYKVSPLSYLLGRMLVRVNFMGLANLIAGKRICPELLQQQVSGAGIAETVASMLHDPTGMAECRGELLNVKARLGNPGASRRVAQIALSLMKKAGASS